MELKFTTEGLRRFACIESYTDGLPPEVVTACRKRLQVLAAAPDETVLVALDAWLHLERSNDCEAQHVMHVMHVMDGWRLVIEFVDGADERVAIIHGMVHLVQESEGRL